MYTRRYNNRRSTTLPPSPPPDYSGTAIPEPEPETELRELTPPPPFTEADEERLKRVPPERKEGYRPGSLFSFPLFRQRRTEDGGESENGEAGSQGLLEGWKEDDYLLLGLLALLLGGKENGVKENADILLALGFLFLIGKGNIGRGEE